VAADNSNPRRVPVAVVLVNWNSWRNSIECINSVLAQSYPDFHIFLVDNDSADNSIEHIGAWCGNPLPDPQWHRHEGVERLTDRPAVAPVAFRVVSATGAALEECPPECRLTLLRSGGNLGFAGGCNAGIRAAGSEEFEFFWLLNTDTVVHRDALQFLVRRAMADEKLGMVGSTIRYYGSPQIVQSLGGARMNPANVTSRLIGEGRGLDVIPTDATDVERELTYIMGASMLVSRRFVQDIGLLQEDYFLYYEEIDWAMRGRRRFKLGYAPQSHIFHRSGASSSQVMPLFTARLYYRNRLKFVSRFFPERLAAARRALVVELLRHTLKGRWGHARVVAAALFSSPSTSPPSISPAT
jgi:GT2 family glycosyltransferase